MKWKVPVIILAIIITLGVAAKFTIDKLFSYIMFSALSGTQINMDSLISLDSLLPDLDNSQVKSQVVTETSDESENIASEENLKDKHESEKNSKNSKDNERSQTELNEDLNKGLNIVVSLDNGNTTSSDKKDVTQINGYKEDIKEASGTASGSGKSDVPVAEKPGKARENKNNVDESGPADDYKNHLTVVPEKSETEKIEKIDEIVEVEELADNQDNNNSKNNSVRDNYPGNDNSKKNEIHQDVDDKSIKVTPDKIKDAEKKVSTTDKAKALGILLSKLKPSDISILTDIAFGGEVSDAELTRAKQIIKERVTEEEKEILKSLFNKYEYLLYE